jgi:hypothetical protein
MAEEPEVWWFNIGTVKWMRHTQQLILSDELFGDL